MRKGIALGLVLIVSACGVINNHHAEMIAKDQIKKYWQGEALVSHGSEEIEKVEVVAQKDSNYLVYASATMQNVMGAKMRQFYLVKLTKSANDVWLYTDQPVVEFDSEPSEAAITEFSKTL